MNKEGRVYVVCAIDTEGPIDDKGKPEILSDWKQVDALVRRLTDQEFRMRFPDSQGKGLVYSWFILHLSGFKTNPFNRPMGYHAVYDHYVNAHTQTLANNNDGIYWHYHHPAPSGVGNEWSRDWVHCTEYYNILSHMVLDRAFFPSCFRAGGRIEDNDLSHWIEQWIPFDFSNCSGNVNWDKIESDGQRLGDVCDWTKASRAWHPYHPSKKDYQREGSQKRVIFRCPDLDSAIHVLSEDEIREAFDLANSGQDAVLAFFEHDRRNNVTDKISLICKKIEHIAREFSSVRWFYRNAKEAALGVLGVKTETANSFDVQLRQDDKIYITADRDIFGNYPYVCILRKKRYEFLPVSVIGRNKWLSGCISFDNLDKLGVAANSPAGEACVNIFNYDGKTNKFVKRSN